MRASGGVAAPLPPPPTLAALVAAMVVGLNGGGVAKSWLAMEEQGVGEEKEHAVSVGEADRRPSTGISGGRGFSPSTITGGFQFESNAALGFSSVATGVKRKIIFSLDILPPFQI
jgi:hypothetical protein